MVTTKNFPVHHGAARRQPRGSPPTFEFFKNCLKPSIWYQFEKYRPNATFWWKKYQNPIIFDKVMAVWSKKGGITWSPGRFWSRRRRWKVVNFGLWICIVVKKLHIPNMNFISHIFRQLCNDKQARVTLTRPPVSSNPKKPSLSRV